MARHKLSLDSLQVETFETVSARPGGGTVFAREATETYCVTCDQTCNLFYQVCTQNQAATCGGFCLTDRDCATVAVSCQGTCDPCTDGYTCVNSCGAHSCICSAFCNTIDVCETAPETGCY